MALDILVGNKNNLTKLYFLWVEYEMGLFFLHLLYCFGEFFFLSEGEDPLGKELESWFRQGSEQFCLGFSMHIFFLWWVIWVGKRSKTCGAAVGGGKIKA